MNIEFNEVNKVPYVVVDDVLTEEELKEAWATLDSFSLDDLLEGGDTGTAYNTGTYKKSKQNKGVFLDQLYGNHPQLCRLAKPLIPKYGEICQEASQLHPAFRPVGEGWNGTILCSYYKNGDYYDAHQDTTPVTGLYWLAKDESKFEGGNLLIENAEPVQFKNNRMVMFPGYCIHQVSPVKMKIRDADDGLGRWCVSLFTA